MPKMTQNITRSMEIISSFSVTEIKNAATSPLTQCTMDWIGSTSISDLFEGDEMDKILNISKKKQTDSTIEVRLNAFETRNRHEIKKVPQIESINVSNLCHHHAHESYGKKEVSRILEQAEKMESNVVSFLQGVQKREDIVKEKEECLKEKIEYHASNIKESASWESIRESCTRRLQDLHKREELLNEREKKVEALADKVEQSRTEIYYTRKVIEKRNTEVSDREEELIRKIKEHNKKLKKVEYTLIEQHRMLETTAMELKLREREIKIRQSQLKKGKELLNREKRRILLAEARKEVKQSVNDEAVRLLKIKDESRLSADENKLVGRAHFDNKRYDEALQSYQLSASMDMRKYGASHPGLVDTYNMIGRSYFKTGYLDEAIEAFNEKLLLQKQIYGENHRCVADTLCYLLGRSRLKNSSFKDAAEEYRQAAEIYCRNGDNEKAKLALELVASATARNLSAISTQNISTEDSFGLQSKTKVGTDIGSINDTNCSASTEEINDQQIGDVGKMTLDKTSSSIDTFIDQPCENRIQNISSAKLIEIREFVVEDNGTFECTEIEMKEASPKYSKNSNLQEEIHISNEDTPADNQNIEIDQENSDMDNILNVNEIEAFDDRKIDEVNSAQITHEEDCFERIFEEAISFDRQNPSVDNVDDVDDMRPLPEKEENLSDNSTFDKNLESVQLGHQNIIPLQQPQ